MVLKAAPGAYSCSTLPLPQEWDPIRRPHVALLLPSGDGIFRVMLSCPENHRKLMVNSTIDGVKRGSIIEIRYDETEFSYYRKESSGWTKVGASGDPFFVEVFTSGLNPLYLIALEAPVRSLMGTGQ